MQNCTLTAINGDAVLTKAKNPKPQRIDFQLHRIDGQWMIIAAE